MTLNGISSIVPGDSYSLFLWKPENLEVVKVEANAEVLFHRSDENGLLEVKFAGDLPEGTPHLTWKIVFKEQEKLEK